MPIIRFWAQMPPLRRTYQEVPNPRALKVPVWTTDLGISLLARKSLPRSIIVLAARVNAANEWGRIRKEITWSKPPAARSEGNAIGLEALLAKRSGRGRSQHP